jgi:tetratricopeptide (TPR) repeat protein
MSILISFAAVALAAIGPDNAHDHGSRLGKLHFESSCSADAHAQFETGLRWLHSFEYQESELSFARAAAADPSCAMAYWGIAMSNYHPLWAAPTPNEFAKGKEAVEKAKSIGAKTARERDYVAAIETFYADADKRDLKTRVLAYSAAMEQLRGRYPNDDEAAVFAGLSLVAAGSIDGDAEYKRQNQAAAVLNKVLARNPDHPGVAHYLIHSFDYPALADLALPAARRYANIAPASAHAQHMPSHIFTRLGYWHEAIKSNRAAESAARAHAVALGMPGSWDQRLHAMDYLAYAYLQTGQVREAAQVLADLKAIKHADPPSPTVAFAVTAIPARVLLERRQWSDAAAFELPSNLAGLRALANHKWAIANVHFAKAVGAARSGKLDAAREEIAELTRIERALNIRPGEYDWRKQILIERQIAEGWLAYAEGRKDQALTLMRSVADLDDANEKHPVTPGAILPAREQLAELLMKLARPREALAEYEASLRRAPRRLAALRGAESAARLAGERAKAASFRAALNGPR